MKRKLILIGLPGSGKTTVGGLLAEGLTGCRQELDRIDGEIVRLLTERFLVGQRIGKIKRENGQPIRDPEREKQVLQSRGDMSPAYRDAIEAVFAAIMAQTREVEQ